jgi:predicted Zn-dependent protease
MKSVQYCRNLKIRYISASTFFHFSAREHPMKQRAIILLAIVAFLIAACSTVPITGRRQLSLVSKGEMQSMSYQQYGEFLKTNKLSTDQKATATVKSVGVRIQRAVETYFTQQGLSDQLSGYQWDFNLVENKDVNAWCMPGGKVVVYTGLLPVTKTDAGLAVVMGHEIAHAVAEHGAERMSQEMLANLGGTALSVALQNKPEETRNTWMTVFGAGTQLGVLLPYSRTHESEADHLGLIFMAMAGYDPNEGVTFWQRMSSAKQGQAPPEFMSTHPSDETRIANLKNELPEALKYYKKKL